MDTEVALLGLATELKMPSSTEPINMPSIEPEDKLKKIEELTSKLFAKCKEVTNEFLRSQYCRLVELFGKVLEFIAKFKEGTKEFLRQYHHLNQISNYDIVEIIEMLCKLLQTSPLNLEYEKHQQTFPNVGLSCFVNAALQFLKPHLQYLVKFHTDIESSEAATLSKHLLDVYNNTTPDITPLYALMSFLEMRGYISKSKPGDAMTLVQDIITILSNDRKCAKLFEIQVENISGDKCILEFCDGCDVALELPCQLEIELINDSMVSYMLLQALAINMKCGTDGCNYKDLPVKTRLPKNLILRYTPSNPKQLFINMSISLGELKYTLTSVMLANSYHVTTTSKREDEYFHFDDNKYYYYKSQTEEFFCIPLGLNPLGFSYSLEPVQNDEHYITSHELSTIIKNIKSTITYNKYDPMPDLSESFNMASFTVTNDELIQLPPVLLYEHE